MRYQVLQLAPAKEWLVHETPAISQDRLYEVQGWQRLTDVAMVAMQVDDLLLASSREIFAQYMRFVLFYMYAQADLVTSVKKNDLRGNADVEFNGFVIAEATGLESLLSEERGERKQDKGLSIQVRESTARKLKDVWNRWERHK
jgi:hypothetical protein